jgi:hypothetical protein
MLNSASFSSMPASHVEVTPADQAADDRVALGFGKCEFECEGGAPLPHDPDPWHFLAPYRIWT